ncbi:hypothetical protein B5X24_HaOG207369 [Helicoverpa armigera]|uniref:DEK-C domain-containing protein n=1 Tax=Helicoverpa armigera TaxID=29058 RepID=A0A2W1BPJ4_HELAM|nr:hypothetical protein B5X24_HaOG207369 [Helicoverpa armigera]
MKKCELQSSEKQACNKLAALNLLSIDLLLFCSCQWLSFRLLSRVIVIIRLIVIIKTISFFSEKNPVGFDFVRSSAPQELGRGQERKREGIMRDLQPPSDEEIQSYVREIVANADLEHITMKMVYVQVFNKYPDFNLTKKKSMIRATVMSVSFCTSYIF